MNFFSGNKDGKKPTKSLLSDDKQKLLEAKYLQSEIHIQENAYIQAKVLLEEILDEDPLFYQAYNSMGWIYAHSFTDYDRAEQFYLYVLENYPDYHHPYSNYIWLLIEQERYHEAEKVMKDALRIPTINKSDIYYKFGEMYELENKFGEAIQAYKKAIMHSLHQDKIESCNASIDRVETKIELKNTY